MRAQAAINKLKSEISTAIMNALENNPEGLVMEDGKQIGTVTWGFNQARKGYTVEPRPAARAKSIKVKIDD